jgi:UDPglucose--hexose-1-phosphate uridylyltransferase
MDKVIGNLIEKLMFFGVRNEMMDVYDVPLVRNQLMALMEIEEPGDELIESLSEDDVDLSTALPILVEMLDLAVKKGFIEDNTTERDLFDAKVMGCLMPRQGELNRKFQTICEDEGKEKATDYFYKLSKDSNYIRMDRIQKNMYWLADTECGELEITVNLSKPEKDPKEIAKAKLLPQASYPKCLLCLENVGYNGRLNHPGRANHRVLPLTLEGEQWYMQYSPYVYYNEHSIVFKGAHDPMSIKKSTFVRLLDFVDELPHYFLGSNADLPIVGGSILSHDHFQGGHHQFPMEVAPIIATAISDKYTDVSIGIVRWPLSVVRLAGENKESLVNLADEILAAWRAYSDEELNIRAYSEVEGETVPHNTITPISRMNRDGLFELDLVLRNNRQNETYPDGIFHPHAHLHHIKKENIGLIEVMGLAVLPARLKAQLEEIKEVLAGVKPLNQLSESMESHKPWIDYLLDKYVVDGNPEDDIAPEAAMSMDEADAIVKAEVGHKFAEVLACAGVYKLDDAGIAGFKKFLESLGMTIEVNG